MADLTANDVTVAIVHKDLTQRRRLNLVTITLGDGAKTIPAGGVPLPALSKFGLHSDMQLFFMNPTASGLPCDYDKTNHKLVYWMGNYDAADGPLIAATGQAPAAHTIRALAYGK
jgi:hypothetical protein